MGITMLLCTILVKLKSADHFNVQFRNADVMELISIFTCRYLFE